MTARQRSAKGAASSLAASSTPSNGAADNVVREPGEAWGRLLVAYVRDPEGNLIEFQQWL